MNFTAEAGRERALTPSENTFVGSDATLVKKGWSYLK
jgi:hypothetical protein